MLERTMQRKLVEWTEAVADGVATADQIAELKRTLARDIAARDFYVAQIGLRAALTWQKFPAAAPSLPTASRGAWTAIWGRMNQPHVFSLIFAAVFLYAGLTVLQILRTAETTRPTAAQPSEKPSSSVRVTQSSDAVWDDEIPVTPQAAYRSLRSGVVELTFAGGAKATLRGPAQFRTAGPQLLELHSGKLLMRVQPQAVGFVVSTPAATIVDLGTEFGVEVQPDLGTDVEVMTGAVQVHWTGDDQMVKTVRLAAGDSAALLRWTSGAARRQVHLGRRPPNPARFLAIAEELPTRVTVNSQKLLAEGPLGYWTFDDPRGSVTIRDRSPHARHGKLTGFVLDAAQAGVGGGKLALEGAGQHVVLGDGPEWNFSESSPFTVMALVRPFAMQTMGILTTFDNTSPCCGWGLARWENRFRFELNATGGPILRMQTPPAPLGEWVHVAATYDGSRLGSGVRLYLNGLPVAAERVSGTAQPGELVGPLPRQQRASIGAYAGADLGRFFHGEIDEVALFDRALSAAEIREIVGGAAASPTP